MVLTNLTGDPTKASYEELACSTEFTTELHNHLIVLLVLNSFLATTAFLGNTLILVALHKESSLHSPSKLLFRSLAATDFCVGLIVQPVSVSYYISALKERWNICRYAFDISYVTGLTLCGISLYTLTAISVDRLLALLLGLRYRQVVTLKRIYLMVILFWLETAVGSAMYFWNYHTTLWFVYIGTSLCVVTSAVCYTKIFLTLRHNQVQAQSHVNQGQPSQIVSLNRARYRKTVTSALWVQLALVVCYLPFAILEVFHPQNAVERPRRPYFFVAERYLATLVLLNSSLNPILYCWKIREVRQAAKNTIRALFC